MISLKELVNRVYSGKVCMRFEYELKFGDNKTAVAMFKRAVEDANMWTMQLVIDKTRDKDSEVYNFTYILPKSGVSLELIAATGLKYLQLHIKEEIQMKADLDFILGEITDGVKG